MESCNEGCFFSLRIFKYIYYNNSPHFIHFVNFNRAEAIYVARTLGNGSVCGPHSKKFGRPCSRWTTVYEHCAVMKTVNSCPMFTERINHFLIDFYTIRLLYKSRTLLPEAN